MTTSYELSLRLKESGVPQEGGEYYWVYHIITDKKVLSRQSQRSDFFVEICRALTLGELVRMLPERWFDAIKKQGEGFFVIHKNLFTNEYTTPEEAAGELLAAIKSQELKQREG